MAEESDARIEQLEKVSQDQQGKMAEMMEMLKTLVKDKAHVIGQQSGAAQPKQRREDPTYLQGSTPPYVQAQPIPDGRIPIWLRTSLNTDTRSRIELRGKYS